MKRTPLNRKAPMKPGKGFASMGTGVRRTRLAPASGKKSAGKAVAMRTAIRRKAGPRPTKAESRRIERIKSGECVCCWLNRQNGRLSAGFKGCDAHHLLSGGHRRGHVATIGGCPWHHRGVKPFDQLTDAEASDLYGPSLAHGSKPFHAVYGTDDELLDLQNQILECEVAT